MDSGQEFFTPILARGEATQTTGLADPRTFETRICNPTETILRNFDKRYLIDLGGRSVATRPTIHFQAGNRIKLNSADVYWPRVVAKPSIGGGSFAVRSFLIPAELAALEDHLNNILGRTGALVQHFEESVTALSERSLVFIGGEYSVRRVETIASAQALSGCRVFVTVACPRIHVVRTAKLTEATQGTTVAHGATAQDSGNR
jgi:hypothetical protein